MQQQATETARILVRDLGVEGGRAYALKIAANGGPMADQYAEAARVIESAF